MDFSLSGLCCFEKPNRILNAQCFNMQKLFQMWRFLRDLLPSLECNCSTDFDLNFNKKILIVPKFFSSCFQFIV